MSKKVELPTLLAVTAHPDDESVCAGVLAMAVERGWRVALACATRGEAGEIADPALATPETLGAVREEELRCACVRLGFDEIYLLNYCDSGMAGTPLNDRPSSFTRADPDVVRRQLVTLVRELRPQSIITFEPYGIYGHPDHIAISRYTTEVFDMAGDAAAYPDCGRPWQPHTLYYGLISVDWFARAYKRMITLGLEAPGMDEVRAKFAAHAAEISSQITHTVDVSAYIPRKVASLECHRTQLKPEAPFYHMVKPEMADLQTPEYYIEVRRVNGALPAGAETLM